MSYNTSNRTAPTPSDAEPMAPVVELAASYERQSYKHDEGIDAQYEANAGAAERDGRRIPNNPRYRFSDNKTTGAAMRRKGLDRLLAVVQSGHAPFKYVYVKDTSRFGRFDDPRVFFELELTLERHNVKLIYATEVDRVDYANATPDEIFPHFIRRAFDAAAATKERHTTKRRTGYGLWRHAAQGFYPGTRAPYGTRRWLVNDKTRVPIQEVPQRGTIRATDCAYVLRWATDHSVSVVREIYARILRGETLRAVAAELNRRGVPSPGAERGIRVTDPDTGLKRAPTWAPREIQSIARNPIYCGELVWGRTRTRKYGEPVPATEIDLAQCRKPIIVREFMERPIIRRVRWLAVQRILAGNRLERDRRRASKPEYLLTGLLICPACGGRLHGHTNPDRGARYYRHTFSEPDRTARSRLATCAHRGRYLRAELLERPVLDLVRHLLTDGRLAKLARAELARLLDDTRAAGRVEATAATIVKITQLEAGIDRAARNAALAQTPAEEESYKRVARELSDEVQRLRASVDELDAEIARAKAVEARLEAQSATVPTPLDLFEQATPAGKKEVLASLVERVVIDCESATAEVVVRAVAA